MIRSVSLFQLPCHAQPIEQMKFAEIKAELEKRGLSAKGVKSVLVKSLQQALNQQVSTDRSSGSIDKDSTVYMVGGEESGRSFVDTKMLEGLGSTLIDGDGGELDCG